MQREYDGGALAESGGKNRKDDGTVNKTVPPAQGTAIVTLKYLNSDLFYMAEKKMYILLNHCCYDFCYMKLNLILTDRGMLQVKKCEGLSY